MTKTKTNKTTEKINEPSEEFIAKVLESVGFKKYGFKDTYYFLPKQGGISSMKKITAEEAREIFTQ